MKKMIIFSVVRDEDNKIIAKNKLRVVNIHPEFTGIGKYGGINRGEFQKLALDLEPSMETFSID